MKFSYAYNHGNCINIYFYWITTELVMIFNHHIVDSIMVGIV